MTAVFRMLLISLVFLLLVAFEAHTLLRTFVRRVYVRVPSTVVSLKYFPVTFD